MNAGTGTNSITDAGKGTDAITHNSAGTVAIAVTGPDAVTLTASQAGATAIASAGGARTVNASTSTSTVQINGNALTAGQAGTYTGGSGADNIIGGAGNDTITGGAAADLINVGSGTDRVVFTTAATVDTVTSWALGAGADNAAQSVVSVNAYLAGLVAGSNLVNTTSVDVAAAAAVVMSDVFGDGVAPFLANENVLRLAGMTAAAAAANLVNKTFAVAGATSGDGIVVSFVDSNNDLNIGVARLTFGGAGGATITAATVNVQAVFTGTYDVENLDIANFAFI